MGPTAATGRHIPPLKEKRDFCLQHLAAFVCAPNPAGLLTGFDQPQPLNQNCSTQCTSNQLLFFALVSLPKCAATPVPAFVIKRGRLQSVRPKRAPHASAVSRSTALLLPTFALLDKGISTCPQLNWHVAFPVHNDKANQYNLGIMAGLQNCHPTVADRTTAHIQKFHPTYGNGRFHRRVGFRRGAVLVRGTARI